MRITAHAGGYGQYRQELLDPGGLAAFRPDAVLLALASRDFLGAVPLAASAEAADAAVAAAVADLRALWARARRLGGGSGALVIQQTFLDLEPPLFGGLDAGVPGAPARLVQRLNAALTDAAAAEGVLLLDLARVAARDGLDAWHDPVRWLQAKMEIAPQAGPMYGELVARLVAAARGKSRKCLVLDLDNTLWGGVIGDDGLAGIVIGQGSGVGEAHLALQAYAKRLSERGIVLAVCSKNDPRVAEAAFDHPEMLLKRGDFAAFVANWTDKAANLRAIAKALNLGLDSLVFVDDNPVEREQVRAALPEVAVPELPADPAHYVRTLAEAGYFEAVAFTADDRARAGQYAANLERESLAAESRAGLRRHGRLPRRARHDRRGRPGDRAEPRPRHPARQQDQPVQHDDDPPHRGGGGSTRRRPAGADAPVPPDRQVRRQRHRQRHAARAGRDEAGARSSSSTG